MIHGRKVSGGWASMFPRGNASWGRAHWNARQLVLHALTQCHRDVRCDSNRASSNSLAMRKSFFTSDERPLGLFYIHWKNATKAPAKILQCSTLGPRCEKSACLINRAMRNACDSDSRCGLACDASARNAKSLA